MINKSLCCYLGADWTEKDSVQYSSVLTVKSSCVVGHRNQMPASYAQQLCELEQVKFNCPWWKRGALPENTGLLIKQNNINTKAVSKSCSSSLRSY